MNALLVAAIALDTYAGAAGDTDQGTVSVPVRLLHALRLALTDGGSSPSADTVTSPGRASAPASATAPGESTC